jgi:hypothetical protein
MIYDVRDGTYTSKRLRKAQEALQARQGGKLHMHYVSTSLRLLVRVV